MTCSTSGYLTKNIWLIYIIFVLTGMITIRRVVQNLSSAKPCAVFLEHRIFRIFGRRLHQKAFIGTCRTFIGWPHTPTASRPGMHVQPCVASQWTCDGRIHRFTRPLLLTEGWDLWLAPRVKWTSFTPVEETDWMPVQLIISWCSLMVHVLLPAMGSYKVYCFLAKVRAPWRTGRSYRGGQKVDSSKSQFKTVWSLLVKQNVNILIFLHLCWWGTNPFSDFPRERHGW